MKDIFHVLAFAFFIVAFVSVAVSSCYRMSAKGIAERICHPYKLASHDADAGIIVCYTKAGMELREWPKRENP
jgi:hypothetical protein